MLFSRCVLSERCGGVCCQFHDLNILRAGENWETIVARVTICILQCLRPADARDAGYPLYLLWQRWCRGCRVHRGRAAEHGARLSCKPRRRVLSSEHSVRSGDGSHPTPTPGTRSNPQPQHFHLATIIDTLTESVLRDIVLLILVIIIICNSAIILSLTTRGNDRQMVLTNY